MWQGLFLSISWSTYIERNNVLRSDNKQTNSYKSINKNFAYNERIGKSSWITVITHDKDNKSEQSDQLKIVRR